MYCYIATIKVEGENIPGLPAVFRGLVVCYSFAIA
jgi:hypothetical protein